MIYWYTGQPGHGKTLHAILKAMEFHDKGRAVYVCNVREFDYEKTGMQRMTPDDFKNWMAFLPDGAVALVDECYMHGMLPKRPNSSAVPPHVQELAVHRHRGIDFIFVCQSPDKQCDSFAHDLIEEHVHVRRMFGTGWVQLRIFDKFQAQAEKATPIRVKRVRLPKRPMGTYRSTEMDTTERRIPWYYIAFAVGVPVAGLVVWQVFGGMSERLTGTTPAAVSAAPASTRATEPSGDGARTASLTLTDYLQRFAPRIASQPWSAPAYDDLAISSEPPRVFCMLSGDGLDANGDHKRAGCSCLTEQGTRYLMEPSLCRAVALQGQYEPYFDERGSARTDGASQIDENTEFLRRRDAQSAASWGAAAMPSPSGAASSGGPAYGAVSSYGRDGLGAY